MILQGDALAVLSGLEAEAVQCVVTSPPYWGLRDYGVDGQLGLEATPDEYVAEMVAVFREVRRVLRRDGTCWLNLGDSYATGGGKVGDHPGGGKQGERFKQMAGDAWKGYRPVTQGWTQPNRMTLPGLKPKDMVGIPWRVAFALQADGWWLRSDIVWSKPNPMPENVSDRPTKSHEYIFLLTKAGRYFYDADAIREQAVSDHPSGNGFKREARLSYANSFGEGRGNSMQWQPSEWRNRRTVWEVATNPFAEAHFATFPEDLVKPCILAGSRPGDMVLDPFAGSGTVGVVAKAFGRNFMGIELNPAYVEMAERRIAAQNPALLTA